VVRISKKRNDMIKEDIKLTRVGIIGNREFNNESMAKQIIYSNLLDLKKYKFKIVVVSGGAKGIDTIAENIAKELGIETRIFRPKTKDKAGYFQRNRKIARYAEYLLCFINRGKYISGTWNTIGYFAKTKYNIDRLWIYDEYGYRWNRENYPKWLKNRIELYE
jgi:hypothetical protein